MEKTWKSFSIADSFGSFLPAPCTLGSDEARDKKYRWYGRDRSGSAGVVVFQYSLSGEGRIAISEKEHRVCAGSGFLCRIYDPRIVYYYPEEAKEPWQFVYLVFKNAMDWVDSLNRDAGYVFKLQPDCQYLRRTSVLLDQPGANIKISAAEGLELVSQLFSDICRARDLGVEVSRSRLLAEKAAARMRDRVESSDSVVAIAEYLGVSVEHLCRVFRREMRISPLSYFQKQKLLHACALLRGGKVSMKEIAARIGCGNAANFSRLFRQHIGMQPSQFRNGCGAVPAWFEVGSPAE